MPRPRFTADLIGELRHRVIAHNQGGHAPVKLQALKDVYSRHYRGRNPEAHAMAKVDAHLAGLAKAGGEFDEAKHPRKQDGEFSGNAGGASAGHETASAQHTPAVRLPLPQSEREHRQMAQQNAGYRALQTAVIPETRFRPGGAALRTLGSLALGTAAAVSLARGRENGFAASALRGAGSAAGRLVGGAASSFVHGAELRGEMAVRRLAGKPMDEATRLARIGAGKMRSKAAARAGGAAGRAFGARSFKLASGTVKALAGGAAAGGETEAAQRVRRRAAVGTIGLGLGLGINGAVAGTAVDPEKIGANIDAYSYRRIQKAVMSEEIGAAQQAMLDVLQKGDDLGDLRKALAPELWSRAGRAVLSGLAGAAGAAIGSGAGVAAHAAIRHFGHKQGNPYRDAHGHFTDRQHAVNGGALGAVIGGAVAGLGMYGALRSHNVNALRGAAEAARSAYTRRLARIGSEEGIGAVHRLFASKPEMLEAAVARHPAVKAAEANVARYGASTDLHYKARIAQDVNEKLANAAAFQDKFRVPKPEGGHTTVGDIKAAHRSRGVTPEQHAARMVGRFVERASPAQFAHAVADLGPEQQKTALDLFSRRESMVSDVDKQIAGHHQKIARAEGKLAEHAEKMRAAQEGELEAKAAVDRVSAGGEGNVDEVNRAYKKASGAATRAEKAHADAVKALEDLKAGGPEITSPVTGQPIAPPTEFEQRAAVDAIREKARGHAERAFEKQFGKAVEAARTKQQQDAAERHNRILGALAVLARAHGTPRGAGTATLRLATAHRKVGQIGRDLTEATRMRDSAQAALDGLKGKRGVNPAHLQTQREALSRQIADAGARAESLHGDLAAARADRASAAHDFQQALEAQAQGRQRRLHILPPGLVRDLSHDLHRAGSATRDAAHAFLQRPTTQRLRAFAEAKAAQAKDVGTEVAHALFFRPDGKGGHTPSWGKIAGNIGIAGEALRGGRDIAGFVHDRLLGNEEQRKKARWPKGVQLERELHPVTGAGFTALTIPHPTDKGERVVLWGERHDNLDAAPKRLHAGGRMSVVRQQHQQAKFSSERSDHGEATGKVHTGDAFGLQGEPKKTIDETIGKLRGTNGILHADTTPGGPRVAYRSPNDQSGETAASAFVQHMRNQYLQRGELSHQQYAHALQALFSKQGQVATPKQAYAMLTNHRTTGEHGKFRNGIFAQNQDFASQDKTVVARGLRAEVDRALKTNPSADVKANLHRAVQIAGIAKGLDEQTVSALHHRIGGQSQHQAQGAPAQGQQPRHAAPERSLAEHADVAPEMPKGWTRQDLANVIGPEARSVRRQLGAHWVGSEEQVHHLIETLAQNAHHIHGLDMRDAVHAASHGILDWAGPAGETKRGAAESIKQGYAEGASDLLERVDHQAKKLKKSADLNDFDALLKAFDPSEARNPVGEWVGAGGGSANTESQPLRRASGVLDARRWQDRQDQGAPLSPFHPLRMAPDIASTAGMQAAWMAANKYMPKSETVKANVAGKLAARRTAGGIGAEIGEVAGDAVRGVRGFVRDLADHPGATLRDAGMAVAERLLPAAAGMGASALKFGVQAGASAAASWGASSAADAAVRTGYHLAGVTPPANPKPKGSLGEQMAGFAGGWAGWAAGETLGTLAAPGAGTFAGAVAGSWAGDIAGKRLYQWFSGYGDQHTRQAVQRFMKPQATA